ncbi:hypothetical protein, partial [uncultured Gammaproteobacteria bacterium]
ERVRQPKNDRCAKAFTRFR